MYTSLLSTTVLLYSRSSFFVCGVKSLPIMHMFSACGKPEIFFLIKLHIDEALTGREQAEQTTAAQTEPLPVSKDVAQSFKRFVSHLRLK